LKKDTLRSYKRKDPLEGGGWQRRENPQKRVSEIVLKTPDTGEGGTTNPDWERHYSTKGSLLGERLGVVTS